MSAKLETPLEEGEIIMHLDPKIQTHYNLLRKIFDNENNLIKSLVPTNKYIEDEEGNSLLIELPKLSKEENERIYLKYKKDFPYLNENANFNVSQDTIDYLEDVMSLDEHFMKDYYSKYVTECHVLGKYINSKLTYLGHVWSFTRKDFPYFYGMFALKASVANAINAINDSKSHVATKLIYNGLIPKMREEGRKELIVLWPLPSMTSLLRKLGFSEFNTEESTPEREFFLILQVHDIILLIKFELIFF